MAATKRQECIFGRSRHSIISGRGRQAPRSLAPAQVHNALNSNNLNNAAHAAPATRRTPTPPKYRRGQPHLAQVGSTRAVAGPCKGPGPSRKRQPVHHRPAIRLPVFDLGGIAPIGYGRHLPHLMGT